MRFHVIEVGALCYSASFLAFYFLSQDWGGWWRRQIRVIVITIIFTVNRLEEDESLQYIRVYLYWRHFMCVEGIDGMVWLSWFVRFIETFCHQVWGAACTVEVKCSTDEVLSAGNGKSGPRWPRWLILKRIAMILVVHWNNSKRFPLAGRAREKNLLNEVGQLFFMQWLWVYLPLWMQGLMMH